MKRARCAPLALSILLVCPASYGAQRTITWQDAEFCQYDVKFDPGRYDQQQLKNTIDVIFTGHIFELPMPLDYLSAGEAGIASYKEACERQIGRVAALPVTNIPGIEDYRKMKLSQLQDWCEFGSIFIRGALGDSAALREYKPSAAQCSRFVDALEGKIDIRAVWRDVVNSTCEKNFYPEACRAASFADESRPDAADRIRREVFRYGWNSCSTPFLKVNDTRRAADFMEAKLQTKFRTRFSMKRHPCSD
jgi:hypothetical protein